MSNDIPIIVATYVGSIPGMDGKAGDATWARAQKVTSFQLVGSHDPATQQTEVKVCYDRKNLYILFECLEDQMDNIVTKFRKDDEAVWLDESIELFISPYSIAEESKTHQFVVNAAGAKTYMRPDWVRDTETWRAATLRLRDRWIAEITIPFSTLHPLGRNENCWRVNFCRNESVRGEKSSWSAVGRKFATCSHFGKLMAPTAPFKFNTFRGPLALLKPAQQKNCGLQAIDGQVKELGSAARIIPEPQEMHTRVSKGMFSINPDTKIVIDDEASAIDLWTIEEFNSYLEERGGKALQVIPSSKLGKNADVARNMIIIGESARNNLLRAICEKDEIRIPRSRYSTSSHVIDILPERIVISGQNPVDTYYGMQTLKQLLRPETDSTFKVQSMMIRDFPRFQFRGVHLLATKDALPYIGKLIDKVLAPLKVNHIILQTDKVAWKSHPEIRDNNNYMEPDDIRKLIGIAKKHHINVTPLVQSPGHLEWAFLHGQNLEFAEDPSHPYCYCMSNPKSYEFIFGIINEAIEIFGQPEYFHAGRDEFDMDGRMPGDEACAAAGKEKLYIQDTLKIYEHLKSKGCKMMMWGDILSKNGYAQMIDSIPKDIIIADWRYSPSLAYPSIDFYQSHGFQIIGCPWYDPRNISTFSSYAAKRGISGMLQTTWTAFKTEEEQLKTEPEQLYAYILSCAWAWNPVKPDVADLPYKPKMVFENCWFGTNRKAGTKFYAADLSPWYNISRIDSGRMLGWLGIGRGNDLRALPEGYVSIADVSYKIPSASLDKPSAILLGGDGMANEFPRRMKDIAVGSKAYMLHFLHACAYGADPNTLVGKYVVHYKDGKSEEIELRYEKNIYAWNDQSVGMSYGFAWRGKGQDGRAVGICDLSWKNPHPDEEITSMDFIASDTQASPFLLALTIEE